MKVKATQNFTLNDFAKIKGSITRNNIAYNEEGCVYTGDVFECDKELCDYLMGQNRLNVAVVEILEIIPEKEDKVVEEVVEKFIKKTPVTKPKKRTSKK